MLTGFMITRPNSLLAWLAAAVFSLLVSACEKVPLMAPTGSTIILTASTNALPVNATTDIIATVLEAAGTPPHSGTHRHLYDDAGYDAAGRGADRRRRARGRQVSSRARPMVRQSSPQRRVGRRQARTGRSRSQWAPRPLVASASMRVLRWSRPMAARRRSSPPFSTSTATRCGRRRSRSRPRLERCRRRSSARTRTVQPPLR